jgi:iron transport multicopper oxidase
MYCTKNRIRYRIRLVSLSCDPNFTFQIDGHDMTVIEVDGVNTVPRKVDAIQIFAGQRYSFVLNANKAVGNYWIRANPNLGATGFAGGINSAVLRYIGAAVADPTTTQATPAKLLQEKDLMPLENPGAVGD